MAGEEIVNRNLDRWYENIRKATLELADRYAMEAENKAKAGGRWQDQTGQARNELRGGAEERGDGAYMVLSHGAEHGLFLELSHGRKYKIIEECLFPAHARAVKAWHKMLKG